VLDPIAQKIKDTGPSTPAVDSPAQWFLFEHECGRYAVSSISEHATFAAGFPGWHRVEPMEVHDIVTPAAIGQTLTDPAAHHRSASRGYSASHLVRWR
jgi:hypothetical protein